MRKTLIVTNDYPPRPGGIQSYLYRFVQELPAEDIAVYCSTWHPARCAEFDAAQPYRIIRNPTKVLLPTLRVRREVASIIRQGDYETVWFGAAAPLALMSHYLRRHTNVQRIVASTHGHEVGWAMLPCTHAALRIIGNGCDVITYVSHYTQHRIGRALGSHPQLQWLPSGVDTARFHPDKGGRQRIRQRHHIASDTPVIVCISRLVPRKGQDTLIKALPRVLRDIPDALLVIVGGGPSAKRLHTLAHRYGVSDHVLFTHLVPDDDLPLYYAAADVFAMPCRTRGQGLDVEGLGIVFLEASATGIPVIAGNSGGAPETVDNGVTGVVVDGRDSNAVATELLRFLSSERRRTSFGSNGREWMLSQWQWSILGQKLSHVLNGADSDAAGDDPLL